MAVYIYKEMRIWGILARFRKSVPNNSVSKFLEFAVQFLECYKDKLLPVKS